MLTKNELFQGTTVEIDVRISICYDFFMRATRHHFDSSNSCRAFVTAPKLQVQRVVFWRSWRQHSTFLNGLRRQRNWNAHTVFINCFDPIIRAFGRRKYTWKSCLVLKILHNNGKVLEVLSRQYILSKRVVHQVAKVLSSFARWNA